MYKQFLTAFTTTPVFKNKITFREVEKSFRYQVPQAICLNFNIFTNPYGSGLSVMTLDKESHFHPPEMLCSFSNTGMVVVQSGKIVNILFLTTFKTNLYCFFVCFD